MPIMFFAVRIINPTFFTSVVKKDVNSGAIKQNLRTFIIQRIANCFV